jgi:ferrochelatase
MIFLYVQPLVLQFTIKRMENNTKRGIILMNLGSPDSTAPADVKRYLMEFLMDERVIDYPFLLRKLLVGGIIVPFRTIAL